MGQGLLKGTQNQLMFLPVKHTDFIFSILAEEWGFVGCAIVLILFTSLFLRGLSAVGKARDNFGALLAFGCTMVLFWHVVINVGMVTGLLPVVGVPLSFVSYGGSSLPAGWCSVSARRGHGACGRVSVRGLELRESGITGQIIVLFDRTGPDDYFTHSLTPVVHDIKTARMFSEAAMLRGAVLDIHVKLDTGMARMGLENSADVFEIASMGGLRIAGLMSHFANADMADPEFTAEQLKKFNGIRDTLFKKGISPMCHIANSAAALKCAEARLDAVRPGIALYGCSPV